VIRQHAGRKSLHRPTYLRRQDRILRLGGGQDRGRADPQTDAGQPAGARPARAVPNGCRHRPAGDRSRSLSEGPFPAGHAPAAEGALWAVGISSALQTPPLVDLCGCDGQASAAVRGVVHPQVVHIRIRGRGDPPTVVSVAAVSLGDHPPYMFVVTEAEAAAIRAVFEQEGELSAAIELRRLFPGITDDAKARLHARTIAGWLLPPAPVTRLHPRKER
jgi:hypothetical protein